MLPTHPKRTLNHSPTSGLSWSETVITTNSTPLSSQLHNVLHKPIGVPPPLHSRGEHGDGALEAMAMRCLLNHLEMLEMESLENVPEMLVKRIWGMIEKSNLQSLHLWQIFRKICPQSSPSLNFKTTTHHHIPLSLLTPSISASPLHYLTSLTLVSSISDSITSLHSLSTLPNLVSLHVNGDSSSTAQTSMINDDTIRLWNKRAKYDKTVFPCLRYLFLRFQLGITELALGELNHVPKLETLVTSRCGVSVREAKKITKDKRWKMTRKSFFAYADTILETSPRGRNYLDVVDSYVTSSLTSSSSASSATPLSLIQLGRQSPTLSTSILFSTQEIECWVKDPEGNERERIQEEAKRKQTRDDEDGKQENGKKRRRIKGAKKRDLLALLEGM